MNKQNLCKRALAMALCLLTLTACLPALAADLQYQTVDSGKYQAKPTVDVPQGGYPENDLEPGVNPFTGLAWDGNYQPIMVNIDLDPLARPSVGVADADVMWELPLHRQGHTRGVALFMGTIPAEAGPVRSARIPMIDLQEQYGAGYVFFGSQETKGTAVQEYIRDRHKNLWDKNSFLYPYIDGIKQRYAPYYVSKRGYVAPHHLMAQVAQILKELGGSHNPTPRPFKFSDTGLDHGASAYYMSMEFRPDFRPNYRYNESTNSYDRYYSDEPYVDGNSGAHCSYANVIVARTKVSWYKNGPDKPVVELVGQGDADIFMNGRYIRGTWVRAVAKKDDHDANLAARMVFLDDQGNELELLRGKTFIHIVDENTPLTIGTEAGESIEGASAAATPEPTKTPKPTKTPRPTRTPRPEDGTAGDTDAQGDAPEQDESFGDEEAAE